MYNNVLEFKAISLASLTLFNSRVRTSMIFFFSNNRHNGAGKYCYMYNDVLIAFVCCHRESSSPFLLVSPQQRPRQNHDNINADRHVGANVRLCQGRRLRRAQPNGVGERKNRHLSPA